MAHLPGRNGVYGGWTHAGKQRVFVRVPTSLKHQSENGSGHEAGRSSDIRRVAPYGAPSHLERARIHGHRNGVRSELEETPIVLVHGLSSGRSLKPVLRALGPRPVFAPDLPGFGMSDQPIHPLDVPGLAAALRRWMLDNRLAPAIVVGFSFGCQVAVELAAQHPASVDRLVLVGPAFDPEARTPGRLAIRWARNAPRSSPRLAPAVVHDMIDARPWRSVRTLQRALEYPIEDRLGEIEAPTLVVRPERDHLVPAEWTERVADLIPDSELVVLPKTAHTIGARQAVRLSALLAPFLTAGDPEGDPEDAEVPAAEPAS